MLDHATPIEFRRRTKSGRTRPAIVVCETVDGKEVEAIAKFSASCDEGVVNLAREAIGACLAGDLGLPITQPWLLDLSSDWVESVVDTDARAIIRESAPVAFGSTWAGSQFNAWNSGSNLRSGTVPSALGVFVFDAIVQNPDRRADNPNCLVSGVEIRVFDHELAFSHGLVIGWKPPWAAGSMQHLMQDGFHIFRSKLRTEFLDFGPVKEAWERITDSRLDHYEAAIPLEWVAAKSAVRAALELIRDARNQIDACLIEIKRVLK